MTNYSKLSLYVNIFEISVISRNIWHKSWILCRIIVIRIITTEIFTFLLIALNSKKNTRENLIIIIIIIDGPISRTSSGEQETSFLDQK